MHVTGTITIGEEHKVIVNGPQVIIFEDGNIIILHGDNFIPNEEMRAAVAGHIVLSAASLVADAVLKEQLRTIGQQLTGQS